MKKIFPVLLLFLTTMMISIFLLGGCGSGESSSVSNQDTGKMDITLQYPQDNDSKGLPNEPAKVNSLYPDPDYIAFYLIDCQNPSTGEHLVDTTRVDYPQKTASISNVPLGQIVVLVAGFDQNNNMVVRGTGITEVYAGGSSSVEVTTTPVGPSPSPTVIPSPSPTPSYSPAPSPTPSYSPSPSPSPSPSVSPSPTPSISPSASPSPSPTPQGYGILYVTSYNPEQINIYNHASGYSGVQSKAPDRVLKSNFDDPVAVAVDPARNILYVADFGSSAGYEPRVSMFLNASTATGTQVPDHVIEESAFTDIRGLFVDSTYDILYVLDMDINGPIIYIYDNISTKPTNYTRTIMIQTYDLAYADVRAFTVDTVTNTGFISDAGNNKVYSYDNFRTLNLSSFTYPDRMINDVDGSLSGCKGIQAHNDKLFVVLKDYNKITVYENALSQNGDAAPTGFIEGTGTLLLEPYAIALDNTHDMLYLTNAKDTQESVNGYSGYSDTGFLGDKAPKFQLKESAGEVYYPIGICVDPTRDE